MESEDPDRQNLQLVVDKSLALRDTIIVKHERHWQPKRIHQIILATTSGMLLIT